MSVKQRLENNPFLCKIVSTIYSLGTNRVTKKGRGNIIIRNSAFLRGSRIKIIGDNNIIEFKGGVSQIKNLNIVITGDNNILTVGRNVSTNGLTICMQDNGNSIVLGEGFAGGGNSELAAIEGTEIIFGKDCLLSANITVRTGDSHSILNADTGMRTNPSASVIFGDHVWIGNTVLVFKGTHIGSNCIIAGGAVVTGKEYASNCIIGGNPAKIIKENVTWLVERV